MIRIVSQLYRLCRQNAGGGARASCRGSDRFTDAPNCLATGQATHLRQYKELALFICSEASTDVLASGRSVFTGSGALHDGTSFLPQLLSSLLNSILDALCLQRRRQPLFRVPGTGN